MFCRQVVIILNMIMQYWLMKSEPEEISIVDLKNEPRHTRAWDGIRNYQARNFMRDVMQIGDLILFYHSSCKVPGVVGLAKVVSAPRADLTGLDPLSPYYDPKATKDNPRWALVDIQWQATFLHPVTLAMIKADPLLKGMKVAQTGQRLSIMPVLKAEYERVVSLGQVK